MGYAFYAERALQRFGTDRPVAWQKVRLLLDRLEDVDLIVWIDADIAWTEPETDLAENFLQEIQSRLAKAATRRSLLGLAFRAGSGLGYSRQGSRVAAQDMRGVRRNAPLGAVPPMETG